MTKFTKLPLWREALPTVGGVAVVGVILIGAIAFEGSRNDLSDTRRADSAAAVAAMDNAQARADEARAVAQRRNYKAF